MRNNDISQDMTDRLMPLSSLKDYQVASDSTDVLGWKVAGADGDMFGVVKDLIVDPQTLRVRYLSVVADRKFFNTKDDQYLLIPIGAAALDKRGKKIFVSYIDTRSVSSYPVYGGDSISEDYEYAVRDTFQKSQHDTLPDTNTNRRSEFEEAAIQQPVTSRRISDDFYNDDNYNENRFYSSSWQEDRADNVDDTRHVATETNVYSEDGTSKTVEDSIATIERMEQLRKRGSITDDEYTLLKKRALDI
ncbi:hypothetical protein DXT99_15720 [Pontibacter diazotrophicus]|uniref:PRC-barrel domain-containing protein n=1 Tax=Pontibacter diazotrophicus TaxID=1400979 RepID=A0A3D8LA30_9BACT|nr:PRC-barrel domain-containing protein [Pontibacter diazotrophicus]RDV14238.1 hypothetical protein DXT99_15720 [Pontibacter diazotrophicus]